MLLSFACSLSLVKYIKQFFFWHSHVVGHFSDNLILLLDDFISLQVIDVFVVLSRHRECFLELINLVLFLLDDLLKAFLDVFLTLKLHDDEGFVEIELLGQLLVQLHILFGDALHRAIRLLFEGDSLSLHDLLFDLKLFDVLLSLVLVLFETVEFTSGVFKFALDDLFLGENLINLFLVVANVGSVGHIDLILNLQLDAETVEAKRMA